MFVDFGVFFGEVFDVLEKIGVPLAVLRPAKSEVGVQDIVCLVGRIGYPVNRFVVIIKDWRKKFSAFAHNAHRLVEYLANRFLELMVGYDLSPLTGQ